MNKRKRVIKITFVQITLKIMVKIASGADDLKEHGPAGPLAAWARPCCAPGTAWGRFPWKMFSLQKPTSKVYDSLNATQKLERHLSECPAWEHKTIQEHSAAGQKTSGSILSFQVSDTPLVTAD